MIGTRNIPSRTLATALLLIAVSAAYAQVATEAPAAVPAAATTDLRLWLTGLAALQMAVILVLGNVLRTLSGPGGHWSKHFSGNGPRALMLAPLLLALGSTAHAQAYVEHHNSMSDESLIWLLAAVNALLLVVLLYQIRLTYKLIHLLDVPTAIAAAPPARVKGPSFWARFTTKMTKQVPVAQEQDIVMHHEYDGIRELDNSLPPWWVWLFYGTIIWGVVYFVNVHVIKIWPDQDTEYRNEMVQAKADVDAYLATMADQVDENTMTQSTDPAMLAQGATIFAANCTPCHGTALEGKEGLGPNLTDDYWKHSGGAKDIFRVIKYGVPEKGMISWKSQLKPIEIAALTDFIMSKHGSDPPNAKAPEGELWQGAKTDSTANTTAKDSVPTAALP